MRGVFINRDMTRDERMAEKVLRDRRNSLNAELNGRDSVGRQYGLHYGKAFYWGIRYGEVRRIFGEKTNPQVAAN